MEIKEFFVLSNFGYSKLGFVARDARSGNLVFEFVPFHEIQIRLKFAIFQVTIPLKTLCRLDVSNLAVHINRFVIEDAN